MSRGSASAASIALFLLASEAGAATSFTDVTQDAGLLYQQHAPQLPGDCVFGVVCDLDRMTGGAAVADVDRDGDPDLYVTRLDAPDLLFVNQGDGTFADGTEAAGLSGFDLQSNAAAFADIDNDGDLDLLVAVIAAAGDLDNNRNFLFVNDGSGHFTEEAVSRGIDVSSEDGRAVWAIGFGDYDADGYVDVHLGEWAGGAHSVLLRNRGAEAPGHFEDATAAAELDFTGVAAFASSFVDLDSDGHADLAIAADFGTSRLFWNDGDGTFSDGTVAASVGTDENGMGSTFGDFDGDGDLDWFVTSIHDPAATCDIESCVWGYTGNRLYRNEGGRHFVDVTDSAGVRHGGWGWGAAWFDMDNDADLDLVMTNGVDFPGTDIDAQFVDDPVRLWERQNGVVEMVEGAVAAGLEDTSSGKGLLYFDYDTDGDLDLFLVNNGDSPPRLYRNDLAADHDWLRVRVIGDATNRDGLGAVITVQADPGGPIQRRDIGASSHFLGQSESVQHFGLGPGDGVVERVTVTLPVSGRVLWRDHVSANQTIWISEFSGRCGVSGGGLLAVGGVIGLRRVLGVIRRKARRAGFPAG